LSTEKRQKLSNIADDQSESGLGDNPNEESKIYINTGDEVKATREGGKNEN
jgi:hypothetical protein